VPDVLGTGLRVLFCGINPGLWSAAVGHHFARPGNRFWKALHLGGLTPRLLAPDEEDELLALGLGITNLVERATAGAAELGAAELRAGGARLAAKAAAARPQVVAVLGVGAYRTAFGRPRAAVGPLPEPIGGSRAWLLPNPSGLNAHYQLPDLAEAFAALCRSLGCAVRRRGSGAAEQRGTDAQEPAAGRVGEPDQPAVHGQVCPDRRASGGSGGGRCGAWPGRPRPRRR
jgi:TDG/mug DNA glycosylase family protein